MSLPRNRGTETGRRPGRALVTFSLILAVFGHLGVTFLDEIPTGDLRNPWFRRGWVSHVLDAERLPEGDALEVVLISNSQGYGKELPDELTYARILERDASRRLGRRVRIRNWSIPGGTAPEMIILVAASRRLRPDILLLVAGPGNFDRHHSRRKTLVGEVASDSRYLLAYGEVRRGLPPGFLDAFERPIDRVEVLLARGFPFWRLRELPAAWLHLPRALGSFIPESRRQSWWAKRSPTGLRAFHPVPRRRLSGSLVASMASCLAEAPGRRLFVSMPLHPSRRASAEAFRAALARRIEERDIELHDFSDAIPDHEFLTATHFSGEGHRRMARQLAAVLAP